MYNDVKSSTNPDHPRFRTVSATWMSSAVVGLALDKAAIALLSLLKEGS